MKAIKNQLLLILTLISLLSCNDINDPYQPITTSSAKRKVLVEDYTGHECGNCPKATESVKTIESIYGENAIIVSVHAGYFAEPGNTPFEADYRTPAGDEWDTFFGISNAGNPNGMINRIDYTSTTHIKAHTTWATEIAKEISQAPTMSIELSANYNSSTKKLSSTIKTTFLAASSDKYKLQVVLVEDSVLGSQKDYSKTPSTLTNYYHNHVLRGAVNGTYGEVLNNATVLPTQTLEKTYTNISINSNYNDKHLSLIAFVYNASTYEIQQVEKVKIN